MANGGRHPLSREEWPEWSIWVRKAIEGLQEVVHDLQEKQVDLRVDVAVLKTKIALWGFIGAAVGTGILNLIFYLARNK